MFVTFFKPFCRPGAFGVDIPKTKAYNEVCRVRKKEWESEYHGKITHEYV